MYHAISTNKIDYEIFTKIYFQPNIEYEDALWPLSSLISLQMLTIRKTLELHCVSEWSRILETREMFNHIWFTHFIPTAFEFATNITEFGMTMNSMCEWTVAIVFVGRFRYLKLNWTPRSFSYWSFRTFGRRLTGERTTNDEQRREKSDGVTFGSHTHVSLVETHKHTHSRGWCKRMNKITARRMSVLRSFQLFQWQNGVALSRRQWQRQRRRYVNVPLRIVCATTTTDQWNDLFWILKIEFFGCVFVKEIETHSYAGALEHWVLWPMGYDYSWNHKIRIHLRYKS